MALRALSQDGASIPQSEFAPTTVAAADAASAEVACNAALEAIGLDLTFDSVSLWEDLGYDDVPDDWWLCIFGAGSLSTAPGSGFGGGVGGTPP